MKFSRYIFAIPFFAASLFAETSEKYQFWESYNPSWYIGGAGFMNDTPVARSITFDNIETANIAEVYTSRFRTTSAAFGYQIFLGYNWNPLVSFEFKFMQTTTPYKFFLNDYFTPDVLSFGSKLFFSIKQIAFGPCTLINFPLSKYFTPYIRFGSYVYYWQRHRHYDVTASQPTTLPMHSNYWAVRVVNGYGIKSQIFKPFGIRLEYECPTNPILDTALKLISGNVSLAGYFVF